MCNTFLGLLCYKFVRVLLLSNLHMRKIVETCWIALRVWHWKILVCLSLKMFVPKSCIEFLTSYSLVRLQMSYKYSCNISQLYGCMWWRILAWSIGRKLAKIFNARNSFEAYKNQTQFFSYTVPCRKHGGPMGRETTCMRRGVCS